MDSNTFGRTIGHGIGVAIAILLTVIGIVWLIRLFIWSIGGF